MPGQGQTKVSLTLKNQSLREELKAKEERLKLLEEKNELLELQKESEKAGVGKPAEPVDEVIFWSKAKQTKIGNFIPEKRALNGDLISREGSLGFDEHLFITSDAKEIAYMRACDAIKSGDVKEVKSIDEANQLTMGVQASKTKTDHKSETYSMSQHG